MKTLFMVRHATSYRNAKMHWSGGPASLPLTAEAHVQARAFAENWAVRPDLIVVSAYVRSVQSATPLAERFSLPLIAQGVQELTYWDFNYSGPAISEEDRQTQVAAFWSRLDPLEKRGGSNAECFVEFIERCKAFRVWVDRTDFQICVCFSHGFFMHAFRALMHGVDLPPREMMAHLHKTLPLTDYANLEVVEFLIDSTNANS